MNVNQDRQRPCTGCGACGAVCPKQAIVIHPDENGFFVPQVAAELCVDCGLCRRVCYSHQEIAGDVAQIHSFCGWHKDAHILKNSASGGITQAIAASYMKQGYLIAGCAYDPAQKKAEHIIVRDPQQLYRISGSKYFQSDMTGFYSALSGLDKDSRLVVFGTPCQIIGVRKAMEMLRYNMEQVILVELFCHGVLSPEVWRAYLRSRPKAEQIKDVRFRTKTYGWHYSANEFLDKENRSTPTERTGDNFFRAFYSKKMFSKACYDCKARQTLGNADLRIGDFWGKRFLNDRKGVSCILAFSEKGEKAVKSCEDIFEVFEADTDEILASQSYDQVYPFDSAIWESAYKAVREQRPFKKIIRIIRGRMPLVKRVKEDMYIFLSNMKYRLLHRKKPQ